MRKVYVNINKFTFDFLNFREACSYVMILAIFHHKYATLSMLKDNVCTACDVVAELLIILAEDEPIKINQTNLRKESARLLKTKDFLINSRDKKSLLLSWGDVIMSIERKGLLPGFGFGSKKFKEHYFGNAEKISVTRFVR